MFDCYIPVCDFKVVGQLQDVSADETIKEGRVGKLAEKKEQANITIANATENFVHTHSFRQVLKLLFALNPRIEKTEMEA